MLERAQAMMDALSRAPEIVRPAKWWTLINGQTTQQLADFGYENFKQTVATRYFTWVVGGDSQLSFLQGSLPPEIVRHVVEQARRLPRHDCLSDQQSYAYNLFTCLVWLYALGTRVGPLLAALEEPVEGNPPRVFLDGRLISQDLANSALEYDSITSAVPAHRIRSVLELGSGYGRDAYLFKKLQPDLRYYLADIPPALCVAERYLSNQFSDRRIFRFREFDGYEQVKEELEAAELAFFLPHQIDLLPPQSIDLFINISSLHEMPPLQIAHYLNAVDRLVRGHAYLKQWKVSRNPVDQVVIGEKDYPIPSRWANVYWRTCRVQTEFFEALFRMG